MKSKKRQKENSVKKPSSFTYFIVKILVFCKLQFTFLAVFWQARTARRIWSTHRRNRPRCAEVCNLSNPLRRHLCTWNCRRTCRRGHRADKSRTYSWKTRPPFYGRGSICIFRFYNSKSCFPEPLLFSWCNNYILSRQKMQVFIFYFVAVALFLWYTNINNPRRAKYFLLLCHLFVTIPY